MKNYEYELLQDGIVVASAYSSMKGKALSAILHYAVVYLEDGAVTIRLKKQRKLKP